MPYAIVNLLSIRPPSVTAPLAPMVPRLSAASAPATLPFVPVGPRPPAAPTGTAEPLVSFGVQRSAATWLYGILPLRQGNPFQQAWDPIPAILASMAASLSSIGHALFDARALGARQPVALHRVPVDACALRAVGPLFRAILSATAMISAPARRPMAP